MSKEVPAEQSRQRKRQGPNEKPELPPPRDPTPHYPDPDLALPASLRELLDTLRNEALLDEWAALPFVQRVRVRLFVRRLDAAFTTLSTQAGSRPAFGDQRQLDILNESLPGWELPHQPTEPAAVSYPDWDEEVALNQRYNRAIARILARDGLNPAYS